jgi:hypothetical protein
LASIIVAISDKAMAHLQGTLIGDFIAEGAVLPDGSREITLGPGTNGQLIAAAAQHPELGGRFIALVARAQGSGNGNGQAGAGSSGVGR